MNYLSFLCVSLLLLEEFDTVKAAEYRQVRRNHGQQQGQNHPRQQHDDRQLREGKKFPHNAKARMPAEFDPVASVLLSAANDFHDRTHEMAKLLIESTQVDVFMIGGTESENQEIYGDLQNSSDRFQLLPFHLDAVWVRDYGPVGILLKNEEDNTESMALIDSPYMPLRPSDDALPCHLSDAFEDWTCYHMDLYFENGNIMSDGQGNLFTSTRMYDWNPDLTRDQVDAKLQHFFGAHTVHALEFAKYQEDGYPMDGTGHIDMFAKLLDPCTVVVAETEAPGFQEITSAAADFFKSLPCGDPSENKYYEVHRVPAWVSNMTVTDEEGNIIDWKENVYYSYTNSLIVNDVILIPSFPQGGSEALDTQALLAYKEASPGRTILMVEMDTPILQDGAIHCMTQQLPVAANSPSPMGLHMPNVTCAAVTKMSCDISTSINPFCQEHASRLLYAPTKEQCAWNAFYVEQMCCKEGTDRELVLPGPFPDEEDTATINITVRLDEHPEESAWIILDSEGTVVAASPYYSPSLAGLELAETFNLTVGVYTFFILDSNGNGMSRHQGGWYALIDDLNSGPDASVPSFDMYWTFHFEVYPTAKLEAPSSENAATTEDMARTGAATEDIARNAVSTAKQQEENDEDLTRRIRR